MKSDILKWHEDGMDPLKAGSWTQHKYEYLFNYMQMFSTGMKNIWNERVYVDLYSGPGCTQIEKPKGIFKGSPLLALSVNRPFDKYIFCEQNPRHLDVLKKRVSSFETAQGSSVFIEGDCNDNVDNLISEIPMGSPSYKVLTFCFVDPFDLGIRFKTITKLANARRIDFLFLLALFMDANRNEKHYVNENNVKVDQFLGSKDWRGRWSEFKSKDNSFPRFLAGDFETKMMSLGYLKNAQNTREFRSDDKNLPLYHLAFFSKSERGYDFWKKGSSYSGPQTSLNFES